MAFAEYVFLIKPALQALAKLPQYVKEAKADDGKVSPAEFLGCWIKVGLDMVPLIPDIIRAEDDEEDLPPAA